MNSYLAIFIGGLIPSILGFIYYHPKVLGGLWMKSLGTTEEELNKSGNMGLIIGLSIACAMYLSYTINAYSDHQEPGMSQILHGFFHGGIQVGIPAAMILTSNGLYQRNSMTNLILNAIFWIVTTGLMGAFLYSVATPAVPAH
jgi:Protein of unknown function (DUF1761)